MSDRLVTVTLTELQCAVLSYAAEIEARTLEEMAVSGDHGASKWAEALRESEALLKSHSVLLDLRRPS